MRRDRSVPEYNKCPNGCVYRVSLRVPTVPVIVSVCRETCKMYVNKMLRPVTLGSQVYLKCIKIKIKLKRSVRRTKLKILHGLNMQQKRIIVIKYRSVFVQGELRGCAI